MALRALLTQLNEDPAFSGLCGLLAAQPKARAWVTGLWGSARAFFWSGAAERLQRPLLLLTPTRDEARELYDQLRIFLQHPDPEREELLLFSGRETLTYERALADMEIEGERLEVLLRLARGEKPVIVAAAGMTPNSQKISTAHDRGATRLKSMKRFMGAESLFDNPRACCANPSLGQALRNHRFTWCWHFPPWECQTRIIPMTLWKFTRAHFTTLTFPRFTPAGDVITYI